jgi:hypothetical protein
MAFVDEPRQPTQRNEPVKIWALFNVWEVPHRDSLKQPGGAQVGELLAPE